MDESASFGEWIKRRRSALLLSRDDLAHQVGSCKLGPTLRLVWASGQHVTGLPYLGDNRLFCAVRPGDRPRFDDSDRNSSPDVLVHCATVSEGRTR